MVEAPGVESARQPESAAIPSSLLTPASPIPVVSTTAGQNAAETFRALPADLSELLAALDSALAAGDVAAARDLVLRTAALSLDVGECVAPTGAAG
jgi:hypothetical protein